MAGGVHLLGVEPERAGERAELGEQLVGFGGASGDGEGLHEPERARQERSLGAGKAVVAGWVAVDERAAGAEAAGDGVDGAPDPR